MAFKNDTAAQNAWGDAYDSIPKSAFALVAWHLANLASDNADAPGAARKRFREEVATLAANGIMDPKQAKRVIAILTQSTTEG